MSTPRILFTLEEHTSIMRHMCEFKRLMTRPQSGHQRRGMYGPQRCSEERVELEVDMAVAAEILCQRSSSSGTYVRLGFESREE
jgi:hypothetical protein